MIGTAEVRKRRPPWWQEVYDPVAIGPGEEVIAERDGWVLAWMPEKSQKGWINLKLHRTVSGPKVMYHLGCNGERMAEGKDQRVLKEHHPAIARWVMEVLGEWLELFG